MYWTLLGCIGLYWAAEIDISVSKLLGFETFANFLRVSVSVLVSEKKIAISVSVKILVFSFSDVHIYKVLLSSS